MQVKLQEQVEAIKTEMFTSFKTFLAQLQTCFATLAIPDFSSMWNPNINERDIKVCFYSTSFLVTVCSLIVNICNLVNLFHFFSPNL